MVKLKNIFKNRNNFMNEISRNILKEASTGDGSTADQGEPDTGFIKKGKSRKLGVDSNKPEPWYEKGGYTQMVFPKADDPYKGDKAKDIQRVQVIKRVINTGEKYTGFQDDVGSWDKYGGKDYSTDFDLEDLLRMYS